MLWQKTLMLVTAVLCGFGTVRSADCNANGVEDALDLVPGGVAFEPEHVWAQASVSIPLSTWPWSAPIVAGDWNADGRVDLATANRDSFNISVFLNQGGGALAEPLYL